MYLVPSFWVGRSSVTTNVYPVGWVKAAAAKNETELRHNLIVIPVFCGFIHRVYNTHFPSCFEALRISFQSGISEFISIPQSVYARVCISVCNCRYPEEYSLSTVLHFHISPVTAVQGTKSVRSAIHEGFLFGRGWLWVLHRKSLWYLPHQLF